MTLFISLLVVIIFSGVGQVLNQMPLRGLTMLFFYAGAGLRQF